MIVTHMRQTDVKVQYTVPQGTELNQLANKATAQYVYIGLKSQEALSQGTDKEQAYYIQLNDKLVTIDELRSTLAKQRQKRRTISRPDMLPQKSGRSPS